MPMCDNRARQALRERASLRSGQHQFGRHLLALGLRGQQKRNDEVGRPEYCSDQHWYRQAELPGGREIGQDRRAESSPDRTLVIAEGGSRRANKAWPAAAACSAKSPGPVGAALVMETWPVRSRSLMSGVLQASGNLGFLLSRIVYGLFYDYIG
jgi:hypothetical protein